MPELPEVETVRKGLSQLVLGKTIKEVSVFWPKIIKQPDVIKFTSDLKGERINHIDRRGKYLIFQLTDFELISHLRMEGKYEFHISSEPIAPHTHVVFKFSDGSELWYQDVRKFGRMALVEKGGSSHYAGLKKLGPEPTLTAFQLAAFQRELKKHHKSIKPLLLDQTLVAGLGNIYVDEALFLAKIHPERAADSLKKAEVVLLRKQIIAVLQQAVAAGGTTVRSYLNALGEAGKFQLSLNVYGKEGTPCPVCGTLIEKIKVAQRGTHFCPSCQKL